MIKLRNQITVPFSEITSDTAHGRYVLWARETKGLFKSFVTSGQASMTRFDFIFRDSGLAGFNDCCQDLI